MESRRIYKKPSTSLPLDASIPQTDVTIPQSYGGLPQSGVAGQGCSYWEDDAEDGASHGVGRRGVEKSKDIIEALPSPSQVSWFKHK